ncbi:citrate synthase-like protein [Pisolithus sp. B1]|nr:citrate synthase-like protein [Pisolithus sp. B1]
MGQETPKAKQARNNSLVVIDNRTGKQYSVPITHNSVPATFFKSIRAPAGPDDRPEDETERGLRISDRGFLNTTVIEGAITYIDGERGILRYRYDAHPMAMLTSAFAYLGSYYGEANPSLQGQTLYTKCAKGDPEALRNMDKQIYRLSWQSAHPGRVSIILFPRVLQTGSSLPDPYSAVAAGCASLYGPLHGGATEAVIRMLVAIGSPDNVPAFLAAVKRREKVLSGFGHRVHKTSDPRSFIIRRIADEVFAVTGRDPLLGTAMALHDAALKDDYFVSRKLAPNPDFWRHVPMQLGSFIVRWVIFGYCLFARRYFLSAIRSTGFPMDFFPVLFVVPRVVGWVAHWRQMMLSPEGVKIWRPRQIYVGPSERSYVPFDERETVQGPGKEPSIVVHSGTPSKLSPPRACAFKYELDDTVDLILERVYATA